MSFPALEARPELTEYQSLYLSEFFALSASRTSNGFGANPIQYVEIVAYLALGMTNLPDTASEFTEAIRKIDNMYLKVKADKEKKKSNEKSTPKSSKPAPKRR